MLEAARAGDSVLLIAPTGGGKTLAGFLPTLVALAEAPRAGLHTLYISPLKALATDVARNLTRPVDEMRLAVSIETRTGDTPANRRARQRADPPNILLTTPESLAVLLSLPDAPAMFAGLASVVMDEAHALAGTKRGDQLALCVARLMTLAPSCRRIGLSATVAHPAAIRAYVGADRVIEEPDGAPPELTMMLPEGELSWAGHMGLDAAPGVMARIREAGMTIVFVNTRAQAELMFQALWRLNEPTLPIALHHGSLEVEQRRRVEAAMAAGKLRAVVATSSLDLGIAACASVRTPTVHSRRSPRTPAPRRFATAKVACPLLGEVEESFVNLLRPGDTFMFAGRLLRFLQLHENVAECAEGGTGEPMVPAYEGGRLPLTTNLADRVRGLLQSPSSWGPFPEDVQAWLKLQKARSRMPGRNDLLVETFPRGDRWYLVAYCFEGRNAHQTLGMLLTRRMERAGYVPLGFVATDYVLGVWSAEPPRDVARLFDQDMLGDDLETWLAESSMLRRTFRNVAVIAGLIERHHPGAEKTRKQVTVNSDLIYDVLRRHQPDHILLRATRADAAGGLTDLSRIAEMLARVKGRVVHMVLSRVSPLAVPVLLEIGRESVRTREDEERLLAEAEAIIAEATGEKEPPAVKAIHRANVVRRRPVQAALFGS
jgi:Lhr-like helicase